MKLRSRRFPKRPVLFAGHALAAGVLAVASLGGLQAQESSDIENIPVFRVTAVARSIKSVNFHHRQGSTELDLTGTALAPKAKGTVRADSKTGATKLEIRADKLPAPWAVNEAMLTYVVWAITPEGRPEPVGELAVGTGDSASFTGSSELQAFGLIVTAEPYFAVTRPSDVVVMEATVKPGTAGTIQFIDAKYELMPSNAYISLLPPAKQAQMKIHEKAPVDLLQARHAVTIAESFGANHYANDTMQKAHIDLKNAEDFFASKADKKKVETIARNVVQLSEDARLISVRKREADALAKERQVAEANIQQARNQAEREANERAAAEARRREAEAKANEQRLIAEQEKHRSELAAMEAARAAQARQQALAEADAARQQALDAQKQAELTKQQADADRNEANRLLADAKAKQSQLSADADAARQRADQAEQDRIRAREELTTQLNLILETKQTARGLVVNMSDVLFDTAQATLKPGAREKLARVAGILQTHPDLQLSVEGHTDSVGSDEYNMGLSMRRAKSVRDYLVAQGVKENGISFLGKGETTPVASNDTAVGRQQNRRVEIVVSGEAIATR